MIKSNFCDSTEFQIMTETFKVVFCFLKYLWKRNFDCIWRNFLVFSSFRHNFLKSITVNGRTYQGINKNKDNLALFYRCVAKFENLKWKNECTILWRSVCFFFSALTPSFKNNFQYMFFKMYVTITWISNLISWYKL